MSSRHRLAVAAVAVVALVAGLVAAVIGGVGALSAGDVPTSLPTPTDPTSDLSVPDGVEVSVGTLTQKGISRTYLVLAPSTVTPQTPLIVGLHGRNATVGLEARRDQLMPYVAADAAVLVYPIGYNQGWNVNADCCGAAAAIGLNDVEFVARVADAVQAKFGLVGPTDLVGYSNGGRLAFDIACRDPERYDAVAAVSAVPTTTSCPDDSVPLPVFTAVNLDDTELPTHEDPTAARAALATMTAVWLPRNGCNGPPTVTRGGMATVSTWTDCASGAYVETATWPRGGHSWPQDVDVGDPDVADLVWSFLAGVHSRLA